jgi:hypothetical protein
MNARKDLLRLLLRQLTHTGFLHNLHLSAANIQDKPENRCNRNPGTVTEK